MTYDRQLLLLGAKRNAVLELAEVHAYGLDSYGNAEYVCIYGLRPTEWYAKGIRLLGRTAVECTRDELADRIGRDVASLAARWVSDKRPVLIDPFAGSGNTLYWLARHLSVAHGVGFESDPAVFALTRKNLRALDLPIDILNVDYVSALSRVSPVPDQLVVAFIAPPWGDALDPATGLDLRRTYPPIPEITERLSTHFAENPILFVVQVHETINTVSVDQFSRAFDWSTLKIYDLLPRGSNHGVLLATRGWKPVDAIDTAT
jgi:16S rRNA G966 N2-methylase RsmD